MKLLSPLILTFIAIDTACHYKPESGNDWHETHIVKDMYNLYIVWQCSPDFLFVGNDKKSHLEKSGQILQEINWGKPYTAIKTGLSFQSGFDLLLVGFLVSKVWGIN